MILHAVSDGPGFTGGTIDRADAMRSDAQAVATALIDRKARLLALDGLDPAVAPDGRLQWNSVAQAPDDTDFLLLGLENGEPRFAALPADPVVMDLRSRAVWAAIEAMPQADAALYATARSLIDWHGRHRFCARCGTATAVIKAGWARQCPNCGAEHFPRVDPVVIMLAEHDGRVLVGRQTPWPPGRYSALAGFVEPGESIEEAVARELCEEAGVRARSVRYVASQPWPFPSSLMIAAVAVVEDDALTLAAHEIEDAFWVTRGEVAASLSGEPSARFIAPPRFAIANTLFRRWLNEENPDGR